MCTLAHTDAFPKGWPYALDDVLHDEYDNVERILELNKRLLVFARDGDIGECVRALKAGAMIHSGDTANFDFTPLHHAAFNGHAELCDVLIRDYNAGMSCM
jgi:hypothetical protein